jgi:hypothetical protein
MICVSWLNLTAETEVCRFMSAFCGVGLVSRAAIVSAEYTFTTPVCDLQPQSWVRTRESRQSGGGVEASGGRERRRR